jgi:adenosylcobyric acid synthase
VTARAVMLCGTASHVGKSLLVAALCRILRQDGVSVAPFKAQNMSNNAAVADGGEIGRAQALQARAAGLRPSVRLNPILLKPVGDLRSQVVVGGRVVDTMDVDAYHRFKETHGRAAVREHYRALAERVDVVVIEGAGSPVEVNLKAHDIANLWMAEQADAAVLLVGDIDRGGVLAALTGTMDLMAPDERDRVAGFLINKFRGERRLLEPALDFLRERWGKRTLGVVPYLTHRLPEEDGQGVADAGTGLAPDASVGVAVVRLPRMANFTDFDPLASEPDVALRYVDRPDQIAAADLVVLPGTKATLADLAWLRGRGLDRAVADHCARGGTVVGICGGYQMLGTRVTDPHGMEGGGEAEGLGLLPVETEMGPDKRCVEATYRPAPGGPLGDAPVTGYEIHMGRTRCRGGEALFADAPDGTGLVEGSVWGCYLHALFENDAARRAVLGPARAAKGLPEPAPVRYGDVVEASLDALAASVRKHVDLEAIRALL